MRDMLEVGGVTPDQVPTFDQLMRVAPTTALVLLIVGIGFFVGWKVRGEAVQILKDWLNEKRRK